MPLSWNEIKDRALRFSRDWAEASREEADAKSFWDAFFDIFGVSRRRMATFERRVPKLGGGSMPPALVKAHQKLDRAVDAAYLAAEKAAGRKAPRLSTDAERVAFLFERYQALSSLLPAAKPAKARRRKAADAED